MRDIQTLQDIQLLVDTFYGRVRENELIGPIFASKIGDNWAPHLDKMYRFWQTILLEEIAYSGSPFLAHAQLPIAAEHFDTWLGLWRTTLDEFFSGPKADEAKWRAERMSEMFQYKLEYYRGEGKKPLI